MARVRKRSWINLKGEIKTAWVCDWVEKNGKRHRKNFSTKRNADAFRIELEGKLQSGSYRAKADSITVHDAMQAFLTHCYGRMQRDERMTPHNYAVYKGHATNHVLRPEHGVGELKLSQLTTGEINGFRDRLRNSGVSVPTTRKILSTLCVALEFCIGNDWLALNVARGVKVIGPRGEGSRKILAPSKKDVQASNGRCGGVILI